MGKFQELNFSADERIQIEKYIEEIDKGLSNEEITPLERFLIAENHKEPDRVPLHLCSQEHNSRAIGATVKQVLKDPKKAILADLAILPKYGGDVTHAYADPHVIGPEEVGSKIFYPEDGTAIFKEFPVKTFEDIEKLEVPDPYTDGKLPMVLQIINFLHEKIGDRVPIWQHLCGPLGHAGDLRGYNTFLRDMIINQELVRALMEFTTELTIVLTKAVMEAGAIAIPWDAIASPEFIGKKNYMELVYPYQREAMTALPPPGAYLGIDGKLHQIIEEYAGVGARGIVLEVWRSNDDLVDFKRRVGNKTTFLSHALLTDLMTETPEGIERKVKENIKILAPGGGYVCTAGVVPIDCPEMNVKSFIAAAKKHGKYPIKINDDLK